MQYQYKDTQDIRAEIINKNKSNSLTKCFSWSRSTFHRYFSYRSSVYFPLLVFLQNTISSDNARSFLSKFWKRLLYFPCMYLGGISTGANSDATAISAKL